MLVSPWLHSMTQKINHLRDVHAENLSQNANYRREILALATVLLNALGRLSPWNAVAQALVRLYVAFYDNAETPLVRPFDVRTDW